jgi:hypothetical protein
MPDSVPDRPVRRPIVQYAGRPSNSPPDSVPDRPIRRPIVQYAGRPSNSLPDSLPDRPIRRPIVQYASRPSNSLPDSLPDRPIRRPIVHNAARPPNNAARPSKLPLDSPPDRPIRRPTIQFAARFVARLSSSPLSVSFAARQHNLMITLVDCSGMALPNTRLLLKQSALPCSMLWTWASQSSMLSIMMANVNSSQIETSQRSRADAVDVCVP